MVEMKKLMTIVLGLMCAVGMAGMAIAGNIDSPGPPSGGSGMYTLLNLYDYLTSGTALTVQTSFQEPGAGPGSTMKSTKQIGDDVKALFVQCDATNADVKTGKKFFSTVGGSWGVRTGTYVGQEYCTLLKTGQTSVYVTGDDGYYATSKGKAFSYTDNANGTITDNVTGLMWAKDGNGAGCYNGSTISMSSACFWAEGLTFASYTDWRLPNLRELLSIKQDFIYTSGQIALINLTFFPNTQRGGHNTQPNPHYVTSTTIGGWANTNNYSLDFNSLDPSYTYGKVIVEAEPRDMASSRYARAVRGGE